MTLLNVAKAQAQLDYLIDEAAAHHQPIIIQGKSANAVLLSEEDWNAMNETLYLVSIPGMRESIIGGMATPVTACSQDLDW